MQEALDCGFSRKIQRIPSSSTRVDDTRSGFTKGGILFIRSIIPILLDEDFSYDVTPYDVIPFANIGADGIHYGFLTDFGRVKRLEDAFIVCVSPMNFGDHVKIIARNLGEFIDVILTLKDASIIENLLNYSKKKDYDTFLKWAAKEAEEDPEHFQKSTYVCNRIQQELNRKPIDNLFEYVEVIVPEQRKKMAPFATFDTLGVVSPDGNPIQETFAMNRDSTIILKDLKNFFKRNDEETKLATIRNLQFFYLIQDDDKLKECVKAEMLKMGLTDEVNRME